MDDLELDPQRVVKSMHIKPGGIFTSAEFDVEYEEIKFVFVDKAKSVIICNACQGAGKKAGRYHGWMGANDMRKCDFCDGKGTLKLKKPVKTL